jgi:hypothetical protein
MKTSAIQILLLLTVSPALFLSACSKSPEPAAPVAASSTAPPPLRAPVDDAQKTVTAAPEEVQKQAAETQATVQTQTAVADTEKKAEDAVSATQTQAQGIIERVKTLYSEKKYSEALASLQELSRFKLTDQQQKWLQDFQGQIQKAMANQSVSDATKAVGGLLGGKSK